MTITSDFEFKPFLMEPTFAERVWGKLDLKPWYEETGFKTAVGEAWLTSPAGKILTGELKGKTLAEVAPDFSLLVKMLFPADKLSVQVHPDDEQAQALGMPRGKTECWYVLEAVPGAEVACGLKSGVGVEDVRKAIADGSLEGLLEMVPVSVGDMVFVDAGTVHAIGAGVTLLEVQQTSDTTYRLYDYGRPRELHLEQGLAVVKTETKAGKIEPEEMDGFTRLIETKYFVVDRFDLPAGTAMEMPMDGVGCVVGIVGSGAVNEVRFGVGQAVVVPDSSVTMTTQHGASFLRCYEPAE
ncbi:class I mannose-6-phosphate isomerase [Granulicella tundricola]|uniref:Mannose-6-phosphate isomerase n=1 Tax=Granulicella tundricola (strain ATCC BAA-1859 / DSM 23138 / MP5ACTX9) TaxID=1198114 RepID=E8WYB1_GRATM|nr:class I mannose-6-phosphate isomerase [Granulicella tundricola]ADW68738.1 Mannose-6-phosphate isomerase [Granulicella tundricola MP5ACTX9]